MAFIVSVLLVFIILMASELWWRHQQPHGEFTRKFVHVSVGSFVAFWPYFLTSTEIMLLSFGFLVATALSKYLNIFRAIHSVQRPTWGEFWFALVVGLLAINLKHPHIYTAALLEMSLADGLAAVVGTRYGNRHRYAVFGSPKSLVVSCLILTGYCVMTPHIMTPALLVLSVSTLATVLENISVQGLDNLVIPLFVAAALTYFS